MEYIYILAPFTSNNYSILQAYLQAFPDLVDERRIKEVFKKSEEDTLASDGTPLIMAGNRYLYVKATASEFNPDMLSGVTDAETFSQGTQPFNLYWL